MQGWWRGALTIRRAVKFWTICICEDTLSFLKPYLAMSPKFLPHVELVTAYIADEDKDILVLLLRVALQVGHHREPSVAIRTWDLQHTEQPVARRTWHRQHTEKRHGLSSTEQSLAARSTVLWYVEPCIIFSDERIK